MPQKLMILIADGMGDYPLPELGDKTPLQAAATPFMDLAASKGILGSCQTIPQGMTPGSDIANMSLLGYDPARYHTGRGPIEAAAQGLHPEPTDLIYRLNLCTVSSLSEQGRMLDHSGGHVQTDHALALLDQLTPLLDKKTLRIVPGFQYRHLLIQKDGANAQEADLDLVPPHDILNQSLEGALSVYAQSPLLQDLLTKAHSLLEAPQSNPTQANTVWPWGQGRALQLPAFEQTFGLQGAIISAVDLIKGLGRAAGMYVPDIPGATGLLDTDYEAKIQEALGFLRTGDFVFVHLEGPDECGHAGDMQSKIEAIERFDARIVGPALQAAPDLDAALCIACDHLTPISVRTHTREPVPFVFMPGGNQKTARDTSFTEATAWKGTVHIQEGHSLLPHLLHLMQDQGR